MRSEGNGVRSEGNVVTCRIAGQSLSRQAKPATLMSRGFMRHSPLPGRSRGPTFLCPLAGTDSTACCCEVDWLWGCLCRRLHTRVHVRMRDDKKADLIPRSRRLHVHTDLGIAAPDQQAAKDACLMAAAADARGSCPAACQRQEAELQDAVCPPRLWCWAMALRASLSSL